MSHDGKAQQRGRRRRNVNLGTTEDDERSGRDGVASVAASKPEFPKEYLSSWPQGWGGGNGPLCIPTGQSGSSIFLSCMTAEGRCERLGRNRRRKPRNAR